MYTQKYLDDILVRLAHHSSAIEGNTITLPETVSIILENTLPNGKSVREFYEIDNHKQAFYKVLELLEQETPLTIHDVLTVHELLTDRLQHDKGKFKTQQNAIIGAEFQTATPQETPFLMVQWLKNTQYQLNHASTEQQTLEALARTHIDFERIHPFSDGNGRIGRLLLLYFSVRYLLAPVVISKEIRGKYIESLATQDVTTLADILGASLQNERQRINYM